MQVKLAYLPASLYFTIQPPQVSPKDLHVCFRLSSQDFKSIAGLELKVQECVVTPYRKEFTEQVWLLSFERTGLAPDWVSANLDFQRVPTTLRTD